jgi:hypothetical protein
MRLTVPAYSAPSTGESSVSYTYHHISGGNIRRRNKKQFTRYSHAHVRKRAESSRSLRGCELSPRILLGGSRSYKKTIESSGQLQVGGNPSRTQVCRKASMISEGAYFTDLWAA